MTKERKSIDWEEVKANAVLIAVMIFLILGSIFFIKHM